VGVTVGDRVQYDGASAIGGVRTPVGSRVITEGTTVTNVDAGGKIITISAGINSGTLPKSSTLIFIKAANYASHAGANKEYCVIPLNTAPPFEGTDLGLVTPAGNANLIVRDFKFGQLDVTVPSAKIQTTALTSATKYFPITYNGQTYKALIA
jgi:hypothetical protein